MENIVTVFDIERNETYTREMNAEELAQLEINQAKEAEAEAEETARLSAKLAIYAKLGLTEEEINTLIS